MKLFLLVAALSSAFALLGYWRALRLHARIRVIEPPRSRAAAHLFDRSRKQKP
jgi:hypothetical protein